MADKKTNNVEIDATSGVQTTGHEWDGIKELDNPMPRWWLLTFYGCILFAIGYMIYYPSIPLWEGSTMGISDQTNRMVLKQDLDKLNQSRAHIISALETTELDDISKNEELMRFAVSSGASLFKVHCSQCHGSGAAGNSGYPNLDDDDWLWGGDINTIFTTISHGVRNIDDEDARFSEMPAFGRDELLDKSQISAVSEYVLKLSKQNYDPALAEKGKTIFADQCAACHGDEGTGNREVGGPNLADSIWLYGGERAQIIAQVNKPKMGVMPSWIHRLGEANVKQLAVFVHNLGGGEKTKAQ